MIIDRRRGRNLYPVVSGERDGPLGAACSLGLKGLSVLYRVAYERRMRMLERRRRDRIGVPVISVGNITLGGTGKTPICRYLAKELTSRGRRVGVATRGYGREGAGTVVIDSGFDRRSWHTCGDEPLLLAKDPAVTAVAIDADRARAARMLAERAGCDVVILDDGFQFVTLERDFDIAVIDAGNPFGFEKLFPAGLLREPVESLRRAGLFWLAKLESVSDDKRDEIIRRLNAEFPQTPVVESRYEPAALDSLIETGVDVGIEHLRGMKVLCVSGVGNPESFERAVERLTGRERIAIRFTDHHPFGEGELSEVEDVALKCGAEYVITTEKDAVRLPGHFKPRCVWLVLRVNVVVTAGGGDLETMLSVL